MRKILFFMLLTMPTSFVYSQSDKGRPNVTYKIDTLLFSKDTSNLFVQEIWDTTIVRSYFCSADSADNSFRYGFLKTKKGLARTYSVKNIRNEKTYPHSNKYIGLRDFGGGYPVKIYRLK